MVVRCRDCGNIINCNSRGRTPLSCEVCQKIRVRQFDLAKKKIIKRIMSELVEDFNKILCEDDVKCQKKKKMEKVKVNQ